MPALCSRLGGKGSGFPLRPAEAAQEAFAGLQLDLRQPVTLRATAAISLLAAAACDVSSTARPSVVPAPSEQQQGRGRMSGWRQKCRRVTELPPCSYVACKAHIYDWSPHGGGGPAAEVSGRGEAETAAAAVASPKMAVYMTGTCQLLFRQLSVHGNWLACNCRQETGQASGDNSAVVQW